MHKRKRHVLMLLIAVTWLGLAGTVTPVLNQDVVCCDQIIKADGAWFGARRDCKAALQELSPASRAKACEQYRKLNDKPWFRPFVYSPSQAGCCLEAAELCGPIPAKCKSDGKQPPDPKCQPAPPETDNPPWLNADASCPDQQRGTISWSQTRASNMDVSVTVSMCGEVIRFINRGGGSPERTPPGMRSFDVCCNSWRNAANTKSPCDARRDIDCDGDLNENDQMPEYFGRARRSDDFVSNSPLSNLPFWKKIGIPSQIGCKDCKWELVRVQYTCKDEFDPTRSASRGRNVFDAKYDYQATWKCPANGQTQQSRDTVTLYDLRCPYASGTRYWP